MNTMRMLGSASSLMYLVLILGCDSESAPKNWPPQSPAKSPVVGFEPSSSASFNDWTYIYKSENEARASGSAAEKIRAESGAIGMAYLIKEGNYVLPFNLFAIKAPGDTYVESQFEILYFDDQRTQIRAVEAEGDRIAIIMHEDAMSPNAGTGMSMSFAFSHPGAKVRCAGQVYELHADGWHHNGRMVHAFSTEPSSGRQSPSASR